MAILGYLKSSILSKIVMAITGFILVMYIVVHTAGNMLVYFGRDAINSYSQFLHSTGPLLWIARIVLLLALILHIITSIKLKLENRGAKPQKYAVRNYVKATLTARTMIWTGLAIFFFVVYHVMHLTLHITNPSHVGVEIYQPEHVIGNIAIERTDVYQMLILGFKNPFISLAYVCFVLMVSFHLNHSIQSMFQTLGFNNEKSFPVIQKYSMMLTFVIAICLISIPVNVLLGVLGGGL